MKPTNLTWFGFLMSSCGLTLSAGCKRKVEVNTPAPPPIVVPNASLTAELEYGWEIGHSFAHPPRSSRVELPPRPVAFLASDRELILRGEAITLTWHTENATTVTIDPIGQVETNGSLTVTPSNSTKYHMVAKGPGGVDVSSVWVTVQPPPAPVVASVSPEKDIGLPALKFQSIFFDYNQYAIRLDQRQGLEDNLRLLLEHPDIHLVIEGYCDEHGSAEYNFALGEKRAEAVKQALVQEGVSPEQIKTASFGKGRPVCVEHTEDCAQRNRRAQFVQDEDKSNPMN